jgi:hypothetical protein
MAMNTLLHQDFGEKIEIEITVIVVLELMLIEILPTNGWLLVPQAIHVLILMQVHLTSNLKTAKYFRVSN